MYYDLRKKSPNNFAKISAPLELVCVRSALQRLQSMMPDGAKALEIFKYSTWENIDAIFFNCWLMAVNVNLLVQSLSGHGRMETKTSFEFGMEPKASTTFKVFGIKL